MAKQNFFPWLFMIRLKTDSLVYRIIYVNITEMNCVLEYTSKIFIYLGSRSKI